MLQASPRTKWSQELTRLSLASHLRDIGKQNTRRTQRPISGYSVCFKEDFDQKLYMNITPDAPKNESDNDGKVHSS